MNQFSFSISLALSSVSLCYKVKSQTVTFTTDVNTNNPGTVMISEAFTPHGNGINGARNTKNIEFYPNCTIEVYNGYGENVYSSIGYRNPWDGTFKGRALPISTYYYIVNKKNGSKFISGSVTIIK